jgi:hypothetical protein
MIITAVLDDRELEARIRRIVAEVLSVNPPREADDGPQTWLISSKFPADILVVVEAPDADAPGVRDEPHWRSVKAVREGDFMCFRDSRKRCLVGYAIADKCERGEHRHMPGRPAVRWWLRDPVRFTTPIPDTIFVGLFHRYDDRRAGFSLLRRDGRYNQKAYCYPLTADLRDALFAEAGVQPPANDAEPAKSN